MGGKQIECPDFDQLRCIVFIQMYLCTLRISFVGQVPLAFGQVTFLGTCPTGQVA